MPFGANEILLCDKIPQNIDIKSYNRRTGHYLYIIFMKKPIFYSLPPAGKKISLKSIAKVILASRNYLKPACLDQIQDFFGAKHILYLSSGRSALWLILKSLSRMRTDRREVIIPAYTCPTVVSAVLKAGLKPILSDINLTDFGYLMDNLEAKLSKNTLAVVVVHLFGYPANVEDIYELSKSHNVFVIEDAAQAFGNAFSDSPEKKLGLLGDAGFFSFGRGKPLSLMHGGLLATQSEEIYREALKIFRTLNHASIFQGFRYLLLLGSYSLFSNPYLYWLPQKMPFLHIGETIFEPDFFVSRGFDLAACMMNEMLESLEKDKEIRKENARWYTTNLSGMSGLERPRYRAYPYLRYPFMVQDKKLRDRILEKLISQGTGATLFYPCPLNELPRLREILKDTNIYPSAKRLSETLITLPVHAGVTPFNRQKIEAIIQSTIAAYQANRPTDKRIQ